MIEINCPFKYSKIRRIVKRIGEKVLEEEGKKDFIVSIAFIKKEEIKELNKKHRNRNKATDILSFPSVSNFPDAEKELGEIVACLEVIKENAKSFSSSYVEELVRIIIHGILHLLGYKHGGEMEKKQELYLELLKKTWQDQK